MDLVKDRAQYLLDPQRHLQALSLLLASRPALLAVATYLSTPARYCVAYPMPSRGETALTPDLSE